MTVQKRGTERHTGGTRPGWRAKNRKGPSQWPHNDFTIVFLFFSRNPIFPSQRYFCRPKNNREIIVPKNSFPETQFSLVNDTFAGPNNREIIVPKKKQSKIILDSNFLFPKPNFP